MDLSHEIYYVVLRGAAWHPIFSGDDDRRELTGVVAEVAAACHTSVHAYCLLPSEARLAVRVGQVTASHFAQEVAERYTQRIERDSSPGHPRFEQQYRGVRMDGRTPLPDLVRHIHLAPLKAGLAEALADYPWSSHHAYTGARGEPWVDTGPMLTQLAQSGADAQRCYLAFMLEGVQEIDTVTAAIRARGACAEVRAR